MMALPGNNPDIKVTALYADTGQRTTHVLYIDNDYQGSSSVTPIWKAAADNFMSAWFDITAHNVSLTAFKMPVGFYTLLENNP
jgi:hypothetical protein